MPIPEDAHAPPAGVHPRLIHSQIHAFCMQSCMHACMHQANMFALIYSHTDLCNHAFKLICLLAFEEGVHVAQAGLEIPVLPKLTLLWVSHLGL